VEETVSFVQITNGRGPTPQELSAGEIKALPEDAEYYEACPKCGEQIEAKKFEKHVDECPGV
jgi:hypothetical protein